jgi:hypothetical protein
MTWTCLDERPLQSCYLSLYARWGALDRADSRCPFLAEEERWSRVYRGRRDLIDHVLCSHALIGAVRGWAPQGSTSPTPETLEAQCR